jgi:phytoene/squalene synthetase
MSDTGKPSTLATAAEFDRRLKSLDEPRWLASRFAAPEGRERLVAVGLFAAELRRALAASEGMLAKIRLQWWRETLEGIAAGQVRRHDLSEELARVFAGRPNLNALSLELIDRFEDVLDDHLHAGHKATPEHEQLHVDQEAALNVLSAAATAGPLTDAERATMNVISAAQIARQLESPSLARKSKAAAVAGRTLRSDLWPAIAHYAGQDRAPLAMRWRILRAISSRKL